MKFPAWKVLKEAKFRKGDRPFRQWRRLGQGVYQTNGSMLVVIRKSTPGRSVPDLFCFALPGKFRGYFPGYSKFFSEEYLNGLTWMVLKAHTNNRAGHVTLRSADPLDPPLIEFRYFEEGSDGATEDLDAVVAGVEFVRKLAAGLREDGLIAEEETPGEAVQSKEELRQFVRDNAWGHHACGTRAIGPRERDGVLGSEFRVHGVQGLRVVDASVFPRIPVRSSERS